MADKSISGLKITVEELREFFSDKNPIELKKGEIFLDYGDKTQKLGILLEGLLYATYVSENGQEWISRFFYMPDNCIVSSHECFIHEKKSSEAIRAYEDSTLIFMGKKEFNDLLDQNPRFERMVRVLAEESYIQALKRVHSFQSLTASQRSKKFISEHRDLVSRIQRQHVASYLGIHRNIFSKILSRL